MALSFSPGPAEASLIKVLRYLLGYNPPLAVGGTRSAAPPQVCLINPLYTKVIKSTSHQPAKETAEVAKVYLRQPTIQSDVPLQEWQLLDENDTVLAGMNASSSKPLSSTIQWPLSPLKPNQVVKLKLRPVDANLLEKTTVTLIAASAAEQDQAEQLLKRSDRLQVLNELLQPQNNQAKNQQLAQELLFAPLYNASSKVESDVTLLRSQAMKGGCKG